MSPQGAQTAQAVHLPDGQNFTVQPVFSGLFFKSNELNANRTLFPYGWTVVLHSEDGEIEEQTQSLSIDDEKKGDDDEQGRSRKHGIHKYRQPTLQNDTVFISSLSNPSDSEYKPPASPSRQIALMLWVTLYWYFQQTEPSPYLDSEAFRKLPLEARPRGEWRIRIRRDGIFKSKNMIPKLERMGLIASLDTSVGTSLDESGDGWDHMFVSKRTFWQIPSGLFLFTLQPARPGGSHPGSPMGSRPGSPARSEGTRGINANPSLLYADVPGGTIPTTLVSTPSFPIGPYYSASHLPTYYPPPPLQYVMTNGVRHPLRPKPPRMGEIFYTRFIPGVGKYLSFRVASLSPKPVPYMGPLSAGEREHTHLLTLSDTSLMQMWLGNERVSAFWGGYVPNFLSDGMKQKHSFPVIGMWDGVPFGYFEIYWVKEDHLGRHIGPDVDDWDRGLHVLVGEEWARGRVPYWLTSLVHWCWQADYRTNNVCLEPRVDNHRFLGHLQKHGFAKVKEFAFPHKQAAFVKMGRDAWEGPAI